MKLGKCIYTGEHGDYAHHILLDEFPNDVLKISTVFSRSINGYSENSILLERGTVRRLVTLLQEWLGEPIGMTAKVKLPKKRKEGK